MDLRALSPQARIALVADWIDGRLDADTADQLSVALANTRVGRGRRMGTRTGPRRSRPPTN